MKLWMLASPKIFKAGQQAGDPREWMPQFESKDGLEEDFPPPWGNLSLFPLRPLTDWIRTTHALMGDMFYSMSNNLRGNLIF